MGEGSRGGGRESSPQRAFLEFNLYSHPSSKARFGAGVKGVFGVVDSFGDGGWGPWGPWRQRFGGETGGGGGVNSRVSDIKFRHGLISLVL